MTDRRPQAGPGATAYPLSPMQQGMLLQSLLAPRSGVNVVQSIVVLPEQVDKGRLRRAWALVAARHDILRTTYHWEGQAEPVQQVAASADLPWVELDVRDGDEAARERGLEAFLEADRTRGFAFDAEPLYRCTLIALGDAEWRLIFTTHHSITDGRMLTVVLREAMAAYASLATDPELRLPPGRAYGAYVEWLRSLDLAPAEAFWRPRLASLIAPTPLGIDRPAAPGPEREAARGMAECDLDRGVADGLAALARAEGVTLTTIVQGAWALLLSRYSGERHVVFGAVRRCRAAAVDGADEIVGAFINTVPVPAHVDPAASLLPWLRELREFWIAVRDVEHVALQQIQAWTVVPTQSPLFNSVVVFESATIREVLRAEGGPWASRDVLVRSQTEYPLAISVDTGSRFRIKVEYDRTCLDHDAVERLIGHLTTLLAGFAADPTRTLGDYPILTPPEREALLAWAGVPSPYPRDATVVSLFAEQAARTPDAVAVVHGSATLTYGELDRRANQVAHWLRAEGVRRGTLVGLCVERSADMIVGALGILKAGGAYVPLDPGYPADRLAFMLEDTRAEVLCTQAHLAARLPHGGARVLCLDADRATLDGQPEQAPAGADADPESLAYIIYTSGSTGRPKGVAVPHRAIVRLVRDTNYATFGPDDVFIAFAPISFDASTLELWGALLNGARVVVFAPHTPSLEELGDVIRDQGVTTLWLTAALFQQMVDHNLASLRGVRHLLAGGDVLSVPHVQRVLRELPGTTLINGYGPTENTTFTCCHRMPPGGELAPGSVPIGRPIANSQVYLLDPCGQLAPIGVPGRLYAGGDGLARGYLNRAELTAERFVPNPIAGAPSARLYDTGDLARWRADGTIEFLGRIDQQVKIRGYRIELGEVESALAAHPGVREAVAIAREDTPGDKRLVGYYVPRSDALADAPADAAALRAHLKSLLPDYMVPAHLVPLSALPVTANGKVDRRALPAPDGSSPDARSYVAPDTPAERALAAIWAEVLRVEQIGIDDNFFELGGDSLLSIQAISRARQAGVALTPKQLFDSPTVRQLAALARPAGPAVTAGAMRDTDAGAEGAVPLTPVQRWFVEAEVPRAAHWNQSFVFAPAESLEPALLARACAAVAARHDAFRLRYVRDGRSWHQSLAPAALAHFPLELQPLPALEADRAYGAFAEAAQRSLDLEHGPLARAVLFRGAPEGERLLIVAHHLIVDGVSWRLLLEDLDAAYRQLAEGREPALPAPSASFASWARAVEKLAADPSVQAEREHWRATVADVRPLPADREMTVPDLVGDAATITVRLGADETRALLQRVPAALGSRVNDALVTALALALTEWTGGEDLTLDLEGHGRDEVGVDVSRTIGWFTAIYPVHLRLPRRELDAVLRIVQSALRGVPRGGRGYGVLRYLAGDATLAGAPRPVVFNYLGQFDQTTAAAPLFRLADGPTGAWFDPASSRRHAIDVNALVLDGRFEARWSYAPARHDALTIQRVADAFVAALRAMIARAAGAAPDVEDTYPLTPMQQLFYAPGAPHDVGVEQWRLVLDGAVDERRLRRAWETVVERHPVLRSSFANDGSGPQQFVHAGARPEWQELDWRDADGDAAARRLAALLDEDRARGFELERAPLLRFTLVRLAADRSVLVWTLHHLLTDRWSWPRLLAEVGEVYRGLGTGEAPRLGAPVPYRRYVDWLAGRDLSATETFWRGALADATLPTPLSPAGAHPDGLQMSAELPLGVEEAARLVANARARQLTLGTLVQGAWALWLARATGQDDVTFGLTVSGRPAELPGIEAMIGLCITNVPVRTRLRHDEVTAAWLRGFQQARGEAAPHEYVSPLQVQRWAGVPLRHRLFDSLIVFQADDTDSLVARWLGDGVRARMEHDGTRTAYPVTLLVGQGPTLPLRLVCRAGWPRDLPPATVLQQLRTLLLALSHEIDRPVGELLALLPAPPRSARAERAAMVPPRDVVERAVLGLVRDLLGAEDIGVEDSFFELGGQSLLATQLLSRLRDAFKVELPFRAVFEHPTVAGLARALGAAEGRPGQVQQIAELLARLDAMSADELASLAISARARTSSRSRN